MILPVRKPHVAGSFYPAEPKALRESLKSLVPPGAGPLIRPKAIILPHAGYLYSGRTAGKVLSQIEVPPTCFLIGPNHRGIGHPFALFSEGNWETPLGAVPIDRDFASGLLESSHELVIDETAHEMEHSLEVEIPLLQIRNPGVKIIPLLIGTLDLERARRAALSMVEFLKGRPPFLLAASSDMNHYENDESTRRKDRYAIEAILALDEEKLRQAVEAHRISMCGYVPVYMMLILAKALGVRKATLVDYRTSAEASGETDRVVGYAGFILE